MTVQEVMTSEVKSCGPNADLATAAMLMWNYDCGAVPVVDGERRVIGMITDRDICIAAATRSSSPSNLRVGEAMSSQVYACTIEDDVHAALRTMRERQVRRLPVLDRNGKLAGLVSMHDLVAEAAVRRGGEVSGEELVETLKSIGARPASVV